MAPNLSLNPDASPAALTRRPLAAGQLGSLAVTLLAERARLVSGWIEHHTRRIERNEQNVLHELRGPDNFWASEQLYNLCRNQPDLCWEIILEILHTPHHESVDWNLAAGPLEDLLVWHGAKFIDKVEK